MGMYQVLQDGHCTQARVAFEEVRKVKVNTQVQAGMKSLGLSLRAVRKWIEEGPSGVFDCVFRSYIRLQTLSTPLFCQYQHRY